MQRIKLHFGNCALASQSKHSTSRKSMTVQGTLELRDGGWTAIKKKPPLDKRILFVVRRGVSSAKGRFIKL